MPQSDHTVSAGKGASSGVGFAIPIDTAKGLVEQVLKYGKVVRPILGITIAPPQTVRQIGVEGVLVLEVPSGGPAERAGIKGTFRWLLMSRDGSCRIRGSSEAA